ncbi:hypothetical protein V8E36_001050 [Tilletia maclaganii]
MMEETDSPLTPAASFPAESSTALGPGAHSLEQTAQASSVPAVPASQPQPSSSMSAPETATHSPALADADADAERRSADVKTGEGAQSNAQHSSSLSTGPLPDYSTLAIVDSLKSSDNTGKTFIVYLIRCGSADAKRRYSEFEALREALVRLFPCYIVPPIPGKHTFGDYATKPSTAKEDANIIARRRRMLGSFLKRCAAHQVLSRSIVFQRFLDGRFSWHDITMSPPLSLLPKSNLRGPASDPTSTPSPTSIAAYNTAPLPAANATPRDPNKRFLDSEAFTNRFAQHLSGSVEKANRRLTKRWTELSADFAELGAVLNSFGLTETGSLATAIERVGSAADTSYMSAQQMLQDWEQHFTDPLQEYVQFAIILQKMLKWRTQKHVQYELAIDTLEIKRAQLDEYERIERDVLRFDTALARGGRGIVEQSTFATGSAGLGDRGTQARPREEESVLRNGGSTLPKTGTMRRSLYGAAAEDDLESNPFAAPATDKDRSSASLNVPNSDSQGASSGPASVSDAGSWTRPDTSDFEAAPGAVDLIRSSSVATVRSSGSRAPGQPRHRGAGNTTGPGGGGSGGILGALSHTFASMMDPNPSGTRLNNIAKLRDTVILLEEAVELLGADLEFATQTIQSDLDRFQRQKVTDFKGMMLTFAQVHRELCRQNLEGWQAAKAEISRIDTDSIIPNSSLARKEREEDSFDAGRSDTHAPPAYGATKFSSAGLEEEGGF